MSEQQTPQKHLLNNPYNDPNQSRFIQTAQQTPQNYFNAQNQQKSGVNSPQKQFQFTQLEPQACLFHPHQMITNFCRCQQLMPLCPECISTHLENHQKNGEFAKIEAIDQTAKHCFQLINEVSQNYEKDLIKIEEFKNKKQNMNQFMVDKLQQARQKVAQIVDTFFDQLQQDFQGYLGNEGESNLAEIQTAEVFINQKYNEIESLKNKLCSSKYIKYLVRVLSTDFQGENSHYHKECEQFLEILEKKTIDIDMDTSKLYTFNMELAKFITIKNADLYQKNHQQQNQNLLQPNSFQNTQQTIYEQKNIYKNPQLLPQQEPYTQHNIHTNQNFKNQSFQNTIKQPVAVQDSGPQKFQQQNHEDAIYQEGFKPVLLKPSNNNSPPNRDFNQQKDPFSKPVNIATVSQVQKNILNQKVVSKDYFETRCNDKIMHCFVEENQNFAFQEIDRIVQNKVQNGQDIDWEFIKLDLHQKLILEGHRSIITPNGGVYITGGYQNNGDSSDQVLQLNPETRQLEQLSSMNKGRSEHGLLYLNNCIYALGGKTQLGTKILDSCERLDLQGGINAQWKEIHSLRGGVYDFSFCTFKNKYILVFGKNNLNQTIIQCYDPKFDAWKILQYDLLDDQIQFDIKSKSGAIQINENCIMIFGGINDQDPKQSNYLLTLVPQQQGQQMKFQVGPCKDCQEFTKYNYSMDSQIFIYQNQIVTTALVQKNKNITREVIIYDGDRWKY